MKKPGRVKRLAVWLAMIFIPWILIALVAILVARADEEPRLAPSGEWVLGTPTLAPSGEWVGGEPVLMPDGTYKGDGSTTK